MLTQINSRKLEDLRKDFEPYARMLIENCKKEGIDIIATSTLRNFASQTALFAIGRTLPGKIITNARAGDSFHNYGLAIDVVPIVSGKAIWDDNRLWEDIGKIGEKLGLEWAGRWTGKLQEKAHFQKAGISIAKLKMENNAKEI